jgi:P-type E1-E2 ATPase
MSKVHYTYLIEYDADMHLEDHFIKDVRGCSVQNLSIHEELGQVHYIFSDKTGTLTQNSLSFKEISVPGGLYDGEPSEIRNSSFFANLKNNEEQRSLF